VRSILFCRYISTLGYSNSKEKIKGKKGKKKKLKTCKA